MNVEENLNNQTSGDDDFIASLEKEEETLTEEEQRLKNKNAEEARKRRKAEEEQKLAEEQKAKEGQPNEDPAAQEDPKEKELTREEDMKSQVNDLKTKYPELDLTVLDADKDFKEYMQGKWFKGGKSLLNIYEDFVNYTSRLAKTTKEEISGKYKMNATPKINGSAGSGAPTDIYTKEEMEKLVKRMPSMNAKEYAAIESKFRKSNEYYKNN